MTNWERASKDPDCKFEMFDGKFSAYVNTKTGCVHFDCFRRGLTPHNIRCLIRFLRRHPEAASFVGLE